MNTRFGLKTNATNLNMIRTNFNLRDLMMTRIVEQSVDDLNGEIWNRLGHPLQNQFWEQDADEIRARIAESIGVRQA